MLIVINRKYQFQVSGGNIQMALDTKTYYTIHQLFQKQYFLKQKKGGGSQAGLAV